MMRYPDRSPYAHYYSQNPFYPDPYNYQPPSAAYYAGSLFRSGVSVPGLLVPPIGIYEGAQAARQGQLQLPGLYGSLTPPVSPSGASKFLFGSKPSGAPDTDWSGVAKVGLVVGGVLAIGLIYFMAKGAAPVADKLGNAGVGLLKARAGV
jgi:hypothetical protein